MINFIICDDEKIITDKVKSIISKTVFKTNIDYKIYTYNKYDDKFDKIMNSKIENKIYILDIEVGNKSGIEVAKEIRNNDWNSIILILTSHYELESLAYKSKILLLDFISKFDLFDKKISKTINMCITKIMSNNKLLLKINRKLIQLDFNNILYITYDTNIRKLKIITFTDTYKINDTLKNIFTKLKGNFIYTHKACIVNMDNVKQIDTKDHIITFTNDSTVDLLSRKYIKDVNEYVND